MIIAAAACAAAGISYIFNVDDDQLTRRTCETVTVSSTIVDQQGIRKYIIQPRVSDPLSYPNEKGLISTIHRDRSHQWGLPVDHSRQQRNLSLQKDFSVIFFWSVAFKARRLQLPTKACVVLENSSSFERSLMKISIGTQNRPFSLARLDVDSPHLLMANKTLEKMFSDSSMQSLPNGILKKKKKIFHLLENQKRFRTEDSAEENPMRHTIVKNVNLCVENLSKILSASCSNNDDHLTTLLHSSSLISITNNNQNKFEHDSLQTKDFHQHREIETDGRILYRARQFGLALGEPMIRKEQSSHSIDQLNRLFSTGNCLLMRQHRIETIEDLIRLFLEQGEDQFSQLLIQSCHIDPFVVVQLNAILRKWVINLTSENF